MATHSSVITWRIPWTKEPGRPQSITLQEADTTWRLNHHQSDKLLSVSYEETSEGMERGQAYTFFFKCILLSSISMWVGIGKRCSLLILWRLVLFTDFTWYGCIPSGSVVKNSPADAGDSGSIPGLGRSPGKNGNPLQYSCLGNLMDRGAWQATVHGVGCRGSDTA